MKLSPEALVIPLAVWAEQRESERERAVTDSPGAQLCLKD